MIVKIGKYQFQKGSSKVIKKLCPLGLEEIKLKDFTDSLPMGRIIIKKPDYALLKVSRKEPIVNRMLKLTNNSKDMSRDFTLLYVNNTFVGYKSKKNVKFIPPFNNQNYMKHLEEHKSKKQIKVKSKDYKVIRRI